MIPLGLKDASEKLGEQVSTAMTTFQGKLPPQLLPHKDQPLLATSTSSLVAHRSLLESAMHKGELSENEPATIGNQAGCRDS
jgi:hypothetical protein